MLRSIFVLNKYGVSITILKKLYELDIAYIDLEFFGKDILKEKQISKSQSMLIMDAFLNSKFDHSVNVINELQFNGLKAHTLSKILGLKITLEDIKNLSRENFCSRFHIKGKMYHEIQEVYLKFKENNNNIPVKSDYSKYLLEVIKKEANGKWIDINKIIDLLTETTYPIAYLNSDIDILLDQELITYSENKVSLKLLSILEKLDELDAKKRILLLEGLMG